MPARVVPHSLDLACGTALHLAADRRRELRHRPIALTTRHTCRGNLRCLASVSNSSLSSRCSTASMRCASRAFCLSYTLPTPPRLCGLDPSRLRPPHSGFVQRLATSRAARHSKTFSGRPAMQHACRFSSQPNTKIHIYVEKCVVLEILCHA